MKNLSVLLALGLFPAFAFSQTEPAALDHIKAGDKVAFSVQTYTQEVAGTAPVLQPRRAAGSYLVESDSGAERVLDYGKGNRLFQSGDQALIAYTGKEGQRIDLPPKSVRHWMPREELKAGMKWSFSALDQSQAINASEHTCDFDGAYKATASDGTHELKINGQTQTVKVVIVSIEGNINLRGCEGTAQRITEHYAYSKELDLVLEQEMLRVDPFGKMLGTTSNRLMKVTGLTTTKAL